MYQLLDADQKPESVRYRFADHAPSRPRGVAYLSPRDRRLLELADAGESHRHIGRLLGLSPGTVSRRLSGLETRLKSREAGVLLDPACPLPNDIRRIAIRHFIAGASLRRLAAEFRMPLAAVQIQVHFARGVVRAATQRRPLASAFAAE